jgi:hypothetical protein
MLRRAIGSLDGRAREAHRRWVKDVKHHCAALFGLIDEVGERGR